MMKQISPKEIRAAFAALAPELFVHVPDREYDCPSREWLMDKYTEWFKTKQYKLGVQKFADEVNDCDDYSARYRVGAQILNARRLYKNVLKQLVGMKMEPCPVAVGEVWYKTRIGGGHAINCAFIDDERTLVFIEPQTCSIVSLNQDELKSMFFVRF